MKTTTTLIFLTLALFYSANIHSQGIGILPLQDNSSFAGAAKHSRVFVQAGHHFIKYDKDERNYKLYTSYDKYIRAIGSGIGLSVNRGLKKRLGDNYNSGKTKSENTFSGMIAPKLSLKGKYTISPSLNINYTYGKIRRANTNNYYQGSEGFLGLSFNSPKSYIALSAKLFRNNHFEIHEKFYYDFAIQLGHAFILNGNEKLAILPQLAILLKSYTYGGDYMGCGVAGDFINYSLGFRYDKLHLAIFNEQRSQKIPTGFQIGWQTKGFKILLSNTFNVNYSAWLTLRYLFNQNNPRKNLLYY